MKTLGFQKIILRANAQHILSTNPAENILYHEYFNVQQLAGRELREFWELIGTKKFSAYLIKIGNGNLLPSEDRVWLEYLDLTRLYNCGIAIIAYVSPGNIFNSLEMEKEITGGAIMKIKIFKNINDAGLWLDQHQPMAG